MIKVTIELWLSMGEELGEDFRSLSHMRSVLEATVKEGTTVGKLFGQLADRYPPIGEKVFDRKTQRFCGDVVVTFNERVISPSDVYGRILQRGDKITVLPVYAGG